METMLVDCSRCQVRGDACHGCVISVLLGVPDEIDTSLTTDERQALDALAGSGLLPPLRLVDVVPAVEADDWPTRQNRRQRRLGA